MRPKLEDVSLIDLREVLEDPEALAYYRRQLVEMKAKEAAGTLTDDDPDPVNLEAQLKFKDETDELIAHAALQEKWMQEKRRQEEWMGAMGWYFIYCPAMFVFGAFCVVQGGWLSLLIGKAVMFFAVMLEIGGFICLSFFVCGLITYFAKRAIQKMRGKQVVMA